MTDGTEILEAMCRAHDREDAAQRGEPSPWDIAPDGADYPAFREERLAAMRAAVREILPARQAVLWLSVLVDEADVDPEDTFIRVSIASPDNPRELAKVSLAQTIEALGALFGSEAA